MRVLLILFSCLFSLNLFAVINCSGDIQIEIDEKAKSMTLSGEYEGSVEQFGGYAGEYYGNGSGESNFFSVTVNTDEDVENVLIIDKKNYRKKLSVSCNEV